MRNVRKALAAANRAAAEAEAKRAHAVSFLYGALDEIRAARLGRRAFAMVNRAIRELGF